MDRNCGTPIPLETPQADQSVTDKAPKPENLETVSDQKNLEEKLRKNYLPNDENEKVKVPSLSKPFAVPHNEIPKTKFQKSSFVNPAPMHTSPKQRTVGFGVTKTINVETGIQMENGQLRNRSVSNASEHKAVAFGVIPQTRARKNSFGPIDKAPRFLDNHAPIVRPVNYLYHINNDGFMAVTENLILEGKNAKYKLTSFLGKGSTCCVFGATIVPKNPGDEEKKVAIKIYRKGEKYYNFAEDEYTLLFSIQSQHPKGYEFLPVVYDKFNSSDHIIIAMELLGISLYQHMKEMGFLKSGSVHGFKIMKVAVYGFNIASALSCIHAVSYLHGDLKPENVALAETINKGKKINYVKLIDFSSSFQLSKAGINFPITTIFYRAPEVCLHKFYTEKIDVWGFGCLIFELFTGHPLFTSYNDELLLLMQMEKFLGPIPDVLLNDSPVKEKYIKYKSSFDGGLNLAFEGDSIFEYITKFYFFRAADEKEKEFFIKMREQLADLIIKCLNFDPMKRPTMDEVLAHPFFPFKA